MNLITFLYQEQDFIKIKHQNKSYHQNQETYIDTRQFLHTAYLQFMATGNQVPFGLMKLQKSPGNHSAHNQEGSKQLVNLKSNIGYNLCRERALTCQCLCTSP